MPGAWKRAMETVEKLHSEGINVAVTPTISQKNLHEIVDITAYFTKKGIPVWYSLYSYDTSANENQLFKIGKENDEFTITDKQAMVDLCNALLEMKKKNSKILITKKLLKTLRDFYAGGQKRVGMRGAQELLRRRPRWAELRDATATTLLLQCSICLSCGKAKEFNDLRQGYRDMHTMQLPMLHLLFSSGRTPLGHLAVAFDQWKNAGLVFRKTAKTQYPKQN